MVEFWKEVVGYEGFYKVSNLGNITSVERVINQSNYSRVLKSKKLNLQKGVYITVRLSKQGVTRLASVHRLVAEAFLSKKDCKTYVNHINGDKHDNNVENLEWVNCSQNAIHARNLGLLKPQKGEANGKSILSNKQVLEIKDMLSKNIPQKDIAKNYNVCRTRISNINTGKCYKDIV